MIKKTNDAVILDKAVLAMRKAVKNVIRKHKISGRPLIVWDKGRIRKIPAGKLK